VNKATHHAISAIKLAFPALMYPVLCYPRSVFLLHCKKPIFTNTQNKNKIMTVYVLIFLF